MLKLGLWMGEFGLSFFTTCSTKPNKDFFQGQATLSGWPKAFLYVWMTRFIDSWREEEIIEIN